MKTIGVIVIALAMLIALTGMVMADQVVPQVPEVQGISTATSIVCEGTVTDTAALGWSLTGQDALAARPTEDDPWQYMLNPMQVQYSTTYDASTTAQHGQTTFINTRGVNTANKLLGQSNVVANTESTYLATGDGGNILGTENIMVDGSAMATSASDRILCPFGGDQGNVIPAYCNIVQSGSKYDLVVGSVVSNANDRFVGTDATLPVVLNYAINVKPYTVAGQGTSPAMGSVSAYIKASIKEGRNGYNYYGPVNNSPITGTSLDPDAASDAYSGITMPIDEDGIIGWPTVEDLLEYDPANATPSGPAETLTYSESSSASGVISSFSKTMSYQSGKALLP